MKNVDSEGSSSLRNTVRTAKREEFAKVPYVHHVPADGRTVFLAPYVDKTDHKWKVHVPSSRGLAWIFAEPVESCYYAELIADQAKDIHVEIMDVIARHYSFDPVLRNALELLRRLLNCAVVLDKYFIWLSQFRRTKNPMLANLVQTDLEFLFGNVRTSYDIMQNMLEELWKKTKQPPLKQGSFRRMVQMTPSNLEQKYGLPKPMIDYYQSTKDFFLTIRKIRDDIYHYQTAPKADLTSIIFCDIEGFALSERHLFVGLKSYAPDIWPTNKIKPNELVSVLALMSYIIIKTVQATEGFSQALAASIIPLESISESYRLFLRSPYVPHLLKLDRYLNEQWIEEGVSYSLMS